MEHPLRNTRLSSVPLLAFVGFVGVLLAFSFIMLILSTLAGLQLGNSLLHPNPFVAFESIWPGQPITSLAAYARQTVHGQLPCTSASSPRQKYVGLDVQVGAAVYNMPGSRK